MVAAEEVKTVFLAVSLGALVACNQGNQQSGRQLQVEGELPALTDAKPELSDLIAQHRQRILNIPGVLGLGIGKCERDPNKLCVLVYAKTDKWPSELPRRLDGHEVELRTTAGELKPLK